MRITDLGTDFVHSWCLEKDGLKVLVDTGYAEDWPHFTQKAEAAGIDWRALDFLFLTHAHDDHAGFLNALLEQAQNLRVIASHKALGGLRRGQNGPGGGVPDADAAAVCRQMVKAGRGRHLFPKLDENFLPRFLWLEDIDLDAFLPGAQGLFLPGHTDDSVGLLWEGLLFCGDAAQNRPDYPLKTTIWIQDMAIYTKSWQTMIGAKPARIYPGHGDPFGPEALEAGLGALSQIRLNPSIKA
jgi:glyoxylase-like metal-dependent hydrolase (beta-lactamase superfamily II)